MTQGTKVTTDPESTNNPIQEGTGIVTSDSLAAESVNQGGAFAEGQDANVSGQPSTGTTANNTDTSGATTLPPAKSAEERSDAGFGDAGFAEKLRNSGGDSQAAGFGAPGFAESLKSGGGDSSSAGFGAPDFKESLEKQGGVAPSYTAIQQIREGQQQPKGEDLKEGGFDGHAPSDVTDIGGKNDPGRVAVQQIAKDNAQSGGDAGASGPKQTAVSGDGQYDALNAQTPA